jgi:hypothetical protein
MEWIIDMSNFCMFVFDSGQSTCHKWMSGMND